uniref:Transmembrane protein n=1 Tax=Setaria digitata TaxID=48799 RepID=A0A915PTC4_9BILA
MRSRHKRAPIQGTVRFTTNLSRLPVPRACQHSLSLSVSAAEGRCGVGAECTPSSLLSSLGRGMSLQWLEFSISTVLLYKAATQIQSEEDSGICIPALYALGACVCLFQAPANIIWRLATVIVILLGTSAVAFLLWTVHHLTDVITTESFEQDTDIFLTATAVAMTCGVRLRTAQYTNIFAYLRTALLLVALSIAFLGMAYSAYNDGGPFLCRFISFQ